MHRKTAAMVGAILLLCGMAFSPAVAGTPKVVVAENYGATW